MTEPQSTDNWTPCEPGELVAHGRRARSALRRRQALRIGAGLVTAGCFVLAVVWGAGGFRMGGDRYADISCREFREHIPHYLAGTISDDEQDQFEAHMDHCPSCRVLDEEARSAPDAARDGAARGEPSHAFVAAALSAH